MTRTEMIFKCAHIDMCNLDYLCSVYGIRNYNEIWESYRNKSDDYVLGIYKQYYGDYICALCGIATDNSNCICYGCE